MSWDWITPYGRQLSHAESLFQAWEEKAIEAYPEEHSEAALKRYVVEDWKKNIMFVHNGARYIVRGGTSSMSMGSFNSVK